MAGCVPVDLYRIAAVPVVSILTGLTTGCAVWDRVEVCGGRIIVSIPTRPHDRMRHPCLYGNEQEQDVSILTQPHDWICRNYQIQHLAWPHDRMRLDGTVPVVVAIVVSIPTRPHD
ncbi:MAG TPA: hypothetical protein VF043_30125, partial [Ktedonobacteraceae bacterium]